MRRRIAQAFTLVELVIVIAIVGILAAIAIPRFIDIRTEAFISQRDGIVGAVRSGILTAAARNQVLGGAGTFPTTGLEEAWNNIGTGCPALCVGTEHVAATACNSADACFETVMEGGYSDARWTETGGLTYIFDSPTGAGAGFGDRTYVYTPASGTFQ